QHDVHDADPTDEQRDKGDDQQHDGERQRDIFSGAENRGEGLHIVFGGGRIAAIKQHTDLTLDASDDIATFGPSVEDAKNVDVSVVAHEGEWNDDGFVFNFGEAEGGDTLAKNADHREAEFAHADGATDGIVEAEDAVGQLLGDEADFAAGLHVGG